LEALADAGALASLGGHRHRAYWQVAGYQPGLPTAPALSQETALPLLRRPSEGQDIVADYRSLGLTLGRHPLALLRTRLAASGVCTATDLMSIAADTQVRVAGLVINRQRPQSASGVTFLSLEDETGTVSIIVWRELGERQRRALYESRLLEVRGRLQRESGILHVLAGQLLDRSRLLGALLPASRDFR